MKPRQSSRCFGKILIDADQDAYYARVLENPVCRWSPDAVRRVKHRGYTQDHSESVVIANLAAVMTLSLGQFCISTATEL